MSTSFTSEITCCTSSFVTHLTFVFFASVSMVLCAYFQQWTLKQRWDALEAAISLLEPSSTVTVQWQKLRSLSSDRTMMSRGRRAVPKTGSFVTRNGGTIFILIFYAHIRELYARSWLHCSYTPDCTYHQSYTQSYIHTCICTRNSAGSGL